MQIMLSSLFLCCILHVLLEFAFFFQIPVIRLVAEVPNDSDISRDASTMVDISHAHSTMIGRRQSIIPHSDLSIPDCSSWPIDTEMKKDDTVNVRSISLDISFKSSSHTGLQTSELVICVFYNFTPKVLDFFHLLLQK